MKTVKELLEQKGHSISSCSPNDSVFSAISVMASKNIGALLVMESGRVVGVISERDYARKISLENRSSTSTKVSEIMSDRVIYAEPSETVEECMAVMTDKHIRHLPVMDDGKLLGMVSIGDLVKEVIAEQKFVIEQLERYISGGP